VPLDPALPAGFYLACGYQPAGRRAVRVDRLDRAAALVARLSRTGPFLPPRELPAILGCRETEVAGVLTGIGYIERDGRFEWRRRGRRDARRRA
jgi:ATP-dependent RNA helicase SUPV3L1/SUV3